MKRGLRPLELTSALRMMRRCRLQEPGCVVGLKEWPLLALAYVILLFSQLEHRYRDTLQTLVSCDADNVANNNGSADSKCAASYSRTIIGTFAYVPGAAWMVIFAISVTPSQETR